MPLSIPTLPTRRSAPRRAVSLECELRTDLWDGPVPHRIRDLSPSGMWLGSQLPLEVGEQVLLSFRPPEWSEEEWPLITRGAVARVGLPRRRLDHHGAGMGISFIGLGEDDHLRLLGALHDLPLYLPAPPVALRNAPLPLQSLELPDGGIASFRAEAPLLTHGVPISRQVRTREVLDLSQATRRGQRSRRYIPREQRLAPRRPHLRLLTA